MEPGLTAAATLTVGDDDTAAAMGSGSVPVLATPRLIALCEQATVLALESRLKPDQTSVSMRIQLDHLAPTRVGGHVSAEATLESVQGRRLVFTVSVSDAAGLVAAGRVTRVVVDIDRFLDKAR